MELGVKVIKVCFDAVKYQPYLSAPSSGVRIESKICLPANREDGDILLSHDLDEK